MTRVNTKTIRYANNYAAVHWKFYGGQLAPEFGVLVLGLEEMSRRWAGYADDDITTIFSELAMKLRHLQDRCLRQPEFTLDLCGASDEIAVGGNLNSTEVDHTTSNEIFRGNNRTWQDSEAQDIDHQNNDLTAMSEALMGSGFLNMERVISFDDMVFSDPDAGGSEMQWL